MSPIIIRSHPKNETQKAAKYRNNDGIVLFFLQKSSRKAIIKTELIQKNSQMMVRSTVLIS